MKGNSTKEVIAVSDHVISSLKKVETGHDDDGTSENDKQLLGFLNEVAFASDGSKQLAAIKKIGYLLESSEQPAEVTRVSIEVFTDVYFRCPTRLPLKRLLLSCLHGANPALQDDIKAVLTTRLKELCTISEGCQVMKLDIDNLLMLLDSLPMSEVCIESILSSVLGFLTYSLTQSSQIGRESSSPVEKNQAMQLCLNTVQTVNKILQRFTAKLTQLYLAGDVTETFRKILTCIKDILISDSFLLNCQCTSGMTLPLLFGVVYKDAAVSMIYNSILGEDIPPPVAPVFPSEIASYDTLSLSSQICLLHGLSTALSTVDLTSEVLEQPDSNLLLTVIRKIIFLSDQSVDSNTNFIRSRCLIAWTMKACQCLDEQDNASLKTQLQGDQEIPQKILSYVWTHWEDPVEPVRHQARIVFENTVQMHLKASNEDPKNSAFVSQLAVSLLEIPWTSKGKFGPLCSLIGHLGAGKFLQLSPQLPYEILEVIGDQSYGNHASELYDKLCSTSREEMSLKGKNIMEENMAIWQQKWVDPILDVLCKGEKGQKNHIMEYMLPKLLKSSPASVRYITKKMSADPAGFTSNNLCALMSCLKKAKSLGHIHQTSATGGGMWNQVVPISVLKRALIHQEDQIRLDALGLIVENPKTTEIISDQDFDLIKSFLPWNLSSQFPAFRQQLVAILKRLFFRIRESGIFLLRNLSGSAKKKPGSDQKSLKDSLEAYKSFLTWLCDVLFTSLYPGVCFPRRSTVLSILTTLLLVMKGEQGSLSALFNLPDHVSPSRAKSLIDCLTDTFEENKKHALGVLLQLPSEIIGLQTAKQVQEYFTVSQDLICTTRPQDCTTAVYLLQLLTHQEQFLHLFSLRDDQQMEKNCLELRQLLCLQSLWNIYQEQLETAKKSLLHASATRPIYPVLHCIRYILATIDLSKVHRVTEWRAFLERLIQGCFDLTAVVSPIISHSSPEGNVPIESFLENDQEKSKEIEESVKLVQEMPQYLIVCCWRSIKEISLLLGQLTLRSPILHEGNTQGMLSVQQLIQIGDYFIDLLLESRHRGAFELAYAGFVSMCEMLWRCPISSLHTLPKQWLKQIMQDVQDSNSPSSRLCATRRSAGVPFYVQALVSTEPVTGGRSCFKEAMKILIELAKSEDTQGENIPKVHALNILRTLFRDTRLGDDVFPFIADGIQAAVLGFLSQDWAIRNSSTLLFSALMTRTFGVPRAKDAQNKKNCLSGRVFFHRFPTVFPFLLKQLEEATSNIGANGQFHLHPGLYPVLMVLGRLLPSILEGKDTNLNLAEFIPYVVRCARSPVFKTRLMAARALQPLVFEQQLIPVIRDLIQQLPKKGEKTSHNLIHGILLQVDVLLKSVSQAPVKVLSQLVGVLPDLAKTSWIVTRENKDFVTRTACLTMLQHLVLLQWPQEVVSGDPALGELIPTVFSLVSELNGDHIDVSLHMPGFVDFITAVGKVLIKFCHIEAVCDKLPVSRDQLYLQLLSHPCYEVRLLGLKELKLVTEGCSNETSLPERGKHMQTDVLNKLISMAFQESHPECLCNVLDVLSSHPNIAKCFWKTKDQELSNLQVLQWIIQLITSHTRDEVSCSGLRFSKVILHRLYKDNQDRWEDSLQTIYQFTALLREASLDHQSVDCRSACVEILDYTCGTYLVDRHNLLGDVPFTMWSILLKLLQDDESHVRDEAGGIVIKLVNLLQKDFVLDSVHPPQALDIAIRLMVVLFCWRKWSECFQTLVSWSSGTWEVTESERQNQEEQLFDKGELNTYEDGITFTRLSISHLREFLTNDLTSATQSYLHAGKKPTWNSKKPQSSGSVPASVSTNQTNVWDAVAKVIAAVLEVYCSGQDTSPRVNFLEVSCDSDVLYDTYGDLSLVLADKLSLAPGIQQHAAVIFDFPTYQRWMTEIFRITQTLLILRGSLESSGKIVADSSWDVFDETCDRLKEKLGHLQSGVLEGIL